MRYCTRLVSYNDLSVPQRPPTKKERKLAAFFAFF